MIDTIRDGTQVVVRIDAPSPIEDHMFVFTYGTGVGEHDDACPVSVWDRAIAAALESEER